MLTSNAGVTTELRWSRRFLYRVLDLDAFRTFVRARALPFMGAEATWSAEIKVDTVRSKKYSSVDGWLGALTLDADELRLVRYDGAQSFSLMVRPRASELTLEITGHEDRIAAVDEILANAMRDLELEQVCTDARQRRLCSVAGKYQLDSLDAARFRIIVTAAIEAAGPSRSFWGNYARGAGRRLERRFDDLVTWQAAVLAESGVTAWDTNAEGSLRTVWMSYNEEGGELSIRISATDFDDADRSLSGVEAASNLSLVEGAGILRRRGIKRAHFITEAPSTAWFDLMVKAVGGLVGPLRLFDGRLTTRDDNQASFTDQTEWIEAVHASWGNLTRVYAWLDGRGATVNLDLDPRRDIVVIELRPASQKDPETALTGLATALKLQPYQGDPYRFRRFGRVYKLKPEIAQDRFPRARYVDFIREALAIAFPGRVPAVAEAVVTQGIGEANEEVRPFYDLDPFLEHLRGPDDFQRASLMVDGPVGQRLAIHVSKEASRLELRSNLPRSRFDPIDDLLRETFPLKLMKTEAPDDKDKPSVIPNVVAILTGSLGLLTAIVSLVINPVLAFRRSPSHLEITFPAKPRDGKAWTSSRAPIRVQWRYTSPRIADPDKIDPHKTACVRVVRQGLGEAPDAAPYAYEQRAEGNATIPALPPGDYQIFVRTLDESAEDRLDVVVP